MDVVADPNAVSTGSSNSDSDSIAIDFVRSLHRVEPERKGYRERESFMY